MSETSEETSAPHFAGQVPTPGYRQLDDEELLLIQEINACSEAMRTLVNRANRLVAERNQRWLEAEADAQTLQTSSLRWMAIGTTHLQEGFMALRRAVCAPTTF